MTRDMERRQIQNSGRSERQDVDQIPATYPPSGDTSPVRRDVVDQRTTTSSRLDRVRGISDPVPGFYRARLIKPKSKRFRAYYVPVLIEFDHAERDEETGELIEDENLRLTIFRRDTYTTTDFRRILAYWTWITPITEEEFAFMREERRWLNVYGTTEGGVDPGEAIDMLKTKPPF